MPDIIVSDFQVLCDSNLRLEDGESHQLTIRHTRLPSFFDGFAQSRVIGV